MAWQRGPLLFCKNTFYDSICHNFYPVCFFIFVLGLLYVLSFYNLYSLDRILTRILSMEGFSPFQFRRLLTSLHHGQLWRSCNCWVSYTRQLSGEHYTRRLQYWNIQSTSKSNIIHVVYNIGTFNQHSNQTLYTRRLQHSNIQSTSNSNIIHVVYDIQTFIRHY